MKFKEDIISKFQTIVVVVVVANENVLAVYSLLRDALIR